MTCSCTNRTLVYLRAKTFLENQTVYTSMLNFQGLSDLNYEFEGCARVLHISNYVKTISITSRPFQNTSRPFQTSRTHKKTSACEKLIYQPECETLDLLGRRGWFSIRGLRNRFVWEAPQTPTSEAGPCPATMSFTRLCRFKTQPARIQNCALRSDRANDLPNKIVRASAKSRELYERILRKLFYGLYR